MNQSFSTIFIQNKNQLQDFSSISGTFQAIDRINVYRHGNTDLDISDKFTSCKTGYKVNGMNINTNSNIN